jgi:hypothetical protein
MDLGAKDAGMRMPTGAGAKRWFALFRLALGLSLPGFPDLLRGAEPPRVQVWNPADLMEAKLLFGFGNGLHGRVFEKYLDTGAAVSNPARIRRKGLEETYQAGLEYFERNRLRDAERCFLEIRAADPKDWEAREGLVRIYQTLGFNSERDSALEELRELHQAGKAWGRTICRDIFSLSGKTIMAFEMPSFEFPERRQILFGMQDTLGGATRFLALVSRMKRRIRPPMDGKSPESAQSVPGYQISFVTERQRRVYFVAYQKPGYSTMKKMVANYLAGS